MVSLKLLSLCWKYAFFWRHVPQHVEEEGREEQGGLHIALSCLKTSFEGVLER